jgi:hypothetical protein
MGLDQYAWALKERPEKDTDFEMKDHLVDDPHPDCWIQDNVFGTLFRCKEGYRALAYWRKHPNLQGLVKQIYRAKGGAESAFSGPVILDAEDIDLIEKHVLEETLPYTEGFFFGTSRPDEKDLDTEFISRARMAIEAGETVVYDSSW